MKTKLAFLLIMICPLISFADARTADALGNNSSGHPEAFYQPREGEAALQFGFESESMRYKFEDSTAIVTSWQTTSVLGIDWGFTDNFSAGAELGYVNGKIGSTAGAPLRTVGFKDVDLFAKFAFPGESMNLYLGGRFLYSAQDNQQKMNGATAEQNAFSGGHAVGVNGGFAAPAPFGKAGLRAEYLILGKRLTTVEGGADNTYTGGNVLEGQLFYEYDWDGMPLGFNLLYLSKDKVEHEVAGVKSETDAFAEYGAGINSRLYFNPDMSIVPDLRWYTTGNSDYKVYDRVVTSLLFRWSL